MTSCCGTGAAARRSRLALRPYRRRRAARQAQGAGGSASASRRASTGLARWRRTRCWRSTAIRRSLRPAPAASPSDGDRDGLPNVLVEAASQGLPASRPRSPAFRNFSPMARMASSCRPTIREPCRGPRARHPRSRLQTQARQAAEQRVRLSFDSSYQHRAAHEPLRDRAGHDRSRRKSSSMSSICSASAIWRAPAGSRGAPERKAFRRPSSWAACRLQAFPGRDDPVVALPPIKSAMRTSRRLSMLQGREIDDEFKSIRRRSALLAYFGQAEARHSDHRGLSFRAAADALRTSAAARRRQGRRHEAHRQLDARHPAGQPQARPR